MSIVITVPSTVTIPFWYYVMLYTLNIITVIIAFYVGRKRNV